MNPSHSSSVHLSDSATSRLRQQMRICVVSRLIVGLQRVDYLLTYGIYMFFLCLKVIMIFFISGICYSLLYRRIGKLSFLVSRLIDFTNKNLFCLDICWSESFDSILHSSKLIEYCRRNSDLHTHTHTHTHTL